jgi:TolB protein
MALRVLRSVLGLLLLVQASVSSAVMEIEIIGAGEHQIPVAIVPFGGEDKLAQTINSVVTGDLLRSGLFAYVKRQGKKFSLIVADSDGYNEQVVLAQNEPIMSPAWSPDGSHLVYVSFETGHATVYVQSLYTNQRMVLANFRGSNSAPAWSPDGKQMAIVLTRDGSSEIYLIRPDGSGIHRITFNGSISTEPIFSPDGQTLLFTSDQGGSPQIYSMPVAGGPQQRLTFGEGNNFSPRYSPDGKSFVYTHFINGKFYIATQDFQTGQAVFLTTGGWEKKPSFAPNGKLILFASEARGRGILATVSSDGRVQQHMFTDNGDAREPVWGPHQ